MDTTDENKETEAAAMKEEGYVPRPAWQVWGARIAFVLFLILVVFQIISIARGGR